MKLARTLQILAGTAAVGLLATACGGNLDSTGASSAAAGGASTAASATSWSR